MKTLISNGFVIDPANHIRGQLDLLLEDGKIAAATRGPVQADRVIDAAGKIVCPGFIDIHMHEDPVDNGKIADGETSIARCMLRMGVTTALGGQCGINVYHPADYLDLLDRDGGPINMGMLAGHEYFRRMAGCTDKYAPATSAQKQQMAADMEKALERGCFGISYGIRYVPGVDMDEMLVTAQSCVKSGKLIAAHVRDDAAGVFAAAKELLDTGKQLGIPVQVSHIGSMAGFGQMEEFLRMIDEYTLNGLDVTCDCYPYYAFSTHLGSTTYDEGWLDRYGCGYDVVELCEGKYKGQRCTEEIFREVRQAQPDCITLCHVMKDTDVDMAFRHPSVMLASDGLLNYGQGHPRAAGSFPRLLAQFVRPGKLDLYKAIEMMTAMPAAKMGLTHKGRLNVGADADIVIFDLNTISDHASFAQPTLAPTGIDYVFIGGELAAQNGQILRSDLGRSIRK